MMAKAAPPPKLSHTEIARFRKAACAPTPLVWLQEDCPKWTGCARMACSAGMVEREGTAGAARFAAGKGRHGDFSQI